MAMVRQAARTRANLPFDFELIHRSHEENFRKSKAADRVFCDLEHNRRYRD